MLRVRHVHVRDDDDATFIDALRTDLDPALVLTTGAVDGTGFDVLVTGRPTRAELDASAALRALVVPYAGLPRATVDLLGDFPHLAVHNLHHNAAPTAELALGLLLAAAKSLVPVDRALRIDDWRPRYDDDGSLLLAGRTAVVLGFGAVGRRVGRALVALDMRVAGVRRRPDAEGGRGEVAVHGASDLPGLLAVADVLVVALPGTPATDGLLDAAALARLPGHAIVVNVGRGSVIDETALYEALRDGRLGAAGLDVWWRYPDDRDAAGATAPSAHPFAALDNVVLSPHRAGHGDRTERLRAAHLAALLNAGAAGTPMPNRCDIAAGY